MRQADARKLSRQATLPTGSAASVGMTPLLSLYLDLLRIAAALTVFLSHAGTTRVSGGFLYQFQPLGQDGVDVFFVLSGLVIAHTVHVREQTARSYAVNRAARIYSVVVPCLVLGLALDAIGHAADPEVYAKLQWFHPERVLDSLASLLMLHELWFTAVAPGSNQPFWSLGYETWYYLAFGLFVYARPGWRWLAAGLAMAVAGPKIAFLLPLWLMGVGAYWLCRHVALGPRLAWLLALATLSVPPLLRIVGDSRSQFPYEAFSGDLGLLVDSRHDFALGLALAVHLLGVRWLPPVAVPAWLARPVRRVANGTFTLYLLHFPLIHCLVAVSPWPNTAWPTRAAVFLVAPLALLALSLPIEARRGWWRGLFDALLPRRRQPG